MTDAIGRLKDACARARRPATHFLVADVEWLIAEVEQREADLVDLIDRVEEAADALRA